MPGSWTWKVIASQPRVTEHCKVCIKISQLINAIDTFISLVLEFLKRYAVGDYTTGIVVTVCSDVPL